MATTKILVIEDEDSVRFDIMEILKLEGFDVKDAPDGKSGVAVAQTFLPDVIVCDIMMPEINGYEVLERIRRDPKTSAIPFLFLTAISDRESRRQGMVLGADDFITKPFTTVELLDAIHARLRRRKHIEADTELKLKHTNDNLFKLISEGLQQPVQSVNMVMDVIRLQMDTLPPQDLRDLLETVDYGNRRLTRLVDEIVLNVHLDTGLISKETINQDGVVLPLREVWMLAIDEARKHATERPDVSIYTDEIDENLTVRCHRKALQFAFSQVIANALTYAKENGEVNIVQWDCEHHGCVQVSHNGVAFAKADLENLFEESHRGANLGLPLVKRIVEAHSGNFYLRTEPDKGTQITMRLPPIRNKS